MADAAADGAADGGGAAWTPLAEGAVFFRPPRPEDLDAVAALEAAGYPPDEAADRGRLAFRLENAPGQFLVAVRAGGGGGGGGGGDEVVGFACGTLTSAPRLTHASMAAHDPAGDTVAIHSVCVGEAHRRRGVASRLLGAYCAYAAADERVRRARLICKPPLVGLYERAGFEVMGPSDVVHGADRWIEMERPLGGGGEAGGGGSGGGDGDGRQNAPA